MIQQSYYEIARENEPVFRGILRELKKNREQRPGGCYVPPDLDTESSLEEIFQKYSEGNRFGKFTIKDFTRPNKESATIFFQDVAVLSGGGAELEYRVNENNSVEFRQARMAFQS